ncbi:inositol oxygenase [Eurytemora carolleeae]|uniref:inositol oxygenase n=1 Tax=Eurytemora carolleeae TaxID=1294199 RepID=UPI000C7630C3|nr:inositol oxygenase [Eurytemora carolleeae]|eukprot:XP_023336449.1 inositol oxygenase-like [Eurytemora affinis]
MRLLINKSCEEASLLDLSEVLRPEPALKDKEAFRDYTKEDEIGERVKRTYYEMHTHQTVAFVQEKRDLWMKFNHMEATVMEALEMLNNLVDESDPDLDLPNIVHAFQTAERIRADHPDDDWFHLVGLIHDLGKVMAFFGEPQWAVVGDTFPVGCKPQKSIVFGDESFKKNKDRNDSRYNTRLGIYQENCGINNVIMSWGHDEYLYQVLLHHMKKCGTSIPDPGLAAIRFHSCYPWHTGGDYTYLMENSDKEMLKWVLEFNAYDLYTKSTSVPDIAALKPYYQSLIDKYLPGIISF